MWIYVKRERAKSEKTERRFYCYVKGFSVDASLIALFTVGKLPVLLELITKWYSFHRALLPLHEVQLESQRAPHNRSRVQGRAVRFGAVRFVLPIGQFLFQLARLSASTCIILLRL